MYVLWIKHGGTWIPTLSSDSKERVAVLARQYKLAKVETKIEEQAA